MCNFMNARKKHRTTKQGFEVENVDGSADSSPSSAAKPENKNMSISQNPLYVMEPVCTNIPVSSLLRKKVKFSAVVKGTMIPIDSGSIVTAVSKAKKENAAVASAASLVAATPNQKSRKSSVALTSTEVFKLAPSKKTHGK